jgi:hypothetical protein
MPLAVVIPAALLAQVALFAGGTTAAESSIAATDALVDWAGRAAPDATAAGAVHFDWPGVAARVAVQGATYVRVNVSTSSTRGTRLRAYAAAEGFLLYPTVQVWAEKDPAFAVKTLWASEGPADTTVTLENIVPPECALRGRE